MNAPIIYIAVANPNKVHASDGLGGLVVNILVPNGRVRMGKERLPLLREMPVLQ
jgi:hypothetical protein